MLPILRRMPVPPLSLLLLIPFLAPAAALATESDFRIEDSFHQDSRNSLKLQFDPAWDRPAAATDEAIARAFLSEKAADYGLPADLANLELARTRESLTGIHFRFQQQIAGIDVERAEIIVSVARADGRIYRVFNNTYPVKSGSVPDVGALLDETAALDAAWNRLRAHGEILSRPAAHLVWIPDNGSFRLHWVVDLELSEPYGGWRIHVDAANGTVVSLEDARLYRVEDELTRAPLSERIDSYTGPIGDREAAMARFESREAMSRAPAGMRANGTGVVFDPDPRATLQNDNLQDGSPASAFTGAYFTRNLLDLQFSGGLYRVTGPWCNIINWDPPNTAPSTTTDGNWTATRGNNAFNDAMTYYQIDKNQRYMQSLGFSGASGIQEGPIGTDTDGVNGADNSYYFPGTNRMAFGHGCVDDSEDVDVMLHEYGHAINHDINPSWGGGDMGAIGEGFGDYWCGSYSYSTPNGPVYHPEWVFSWDGHGTGNQCWPGRILNAFGARYDHNTFYGAHQSIPGGYQSDELWSTPNFQTLLALDQMGYPREQTDQIILDSQFGLGGGLKMRDMANAIIQTAQILYPAGPHADVFVEKFLVHEIIDVPHVSLQSTALLLMDAGSNGAADPGESVSFKIEVANTGNLGATSVSAELTSSTPGVVVNRGSSPYPDLPAGGSGENTSDFWISLPASHECGDPVALALTVSFDDGEPGQTTLHLPMGTGVPIGAAVSVNPELSIPDDNPTGISSPITISGTGALVTENFNVDIDITHTWIGDLIVDLRSPVGTNVRLHDRSGSSDDDIVGNYPNSLTPAQSLAAFLGEPLDGTWHLSVSDHAGQDVGVLHSWGINDVSGFECDTATDVITLGFGLPTSFSLHAARPNPFGSATTIGFAIPGAGDDVSLAVFDIAGRRIRTLHDGFLPGGEHATTWSGTDEAGQRLSSGIYFYRLEGTEFEETRKLVLLQ